MNQEKWPRPKAMKIREIIERIDMCPCGTDAHWKVILEVLTEGENHTQNGFYRNEWFEFAAKVLDSWNLLEHGTGIGFAWLTEEGKLLLEFLRDFGTEGYDITDDTGHPLWSIEYSWTLDDDPADHYGRWAKLTARPN
jgi:hypothetical protein